MVVGDEDILGDLSLSADLAPHIPGAQLLVLKQAAHGLLTESQEATAAAIRDFLSDLGKRSFRRGRPRIWGHRVDPVGKAKTHFGNAK